MSSVTTLAELVNLDSANLTYSELAELDSQDAEHASPEPASLTDREWAAAAFAADAEPEPCDGCTGGEWDDFDDFVVELGPDPETDFDALMVEQWTLTEYVA